MLNIKTEAILGRVAALFFLRIFGAVTQMAFLVWIARYVGINNFGVFSTSLTLTLISSVIGRWGADQWVLRELPATLSVERQRQFESVLINGLLLTLFASGIVSLTLFLAAEDIALVLIRGEVTNAGVFLKLMTLSVIPFAFANFFSEVLRSVDRHILSTLLQTVIVPLTSIIIVSILAFSGWPPLMVVGISYVTGCLVAFTGGLIAVGTLYKQRAKNSRSKLNLSGALRETTPIAIVLLLSTWLAYADLLLIGFYSNTSEVGAYAAAQRIVLLLSFLTISYNSLLGPKFSALNQNADRHGVIELYLDSRRKLIKVVLPVAAGIAFASSEILSIFGEDFSKATPVLLLLLLGRLINVVAGPVEVVMMMLKYISEFTRYTVFAILAHLILSFLLTSKFGAIGAAVSTLIATALISFLCLRFVNKIRSGEVVMISDQSAR